MRISSVLEREFWVARISYRKQGGEDVFGTLAEGMIVQIHFLSGMMSMRMMIILEIKKSKPTSCLLPCFHYYTCFNKQTRRAIQASHSLFPSMWRVTNKQGEERDWERTWVGQVSRALGQQISRITSPVATSDSAGQMLNPVIAFPGFVLF